MEAAPSGGQVRAAEDFVRGIREALDARVARTEPA
jgi:hypothetical protein